MEHLILLAVLTSAPHWPLVAFMAACWMALVDLACAGWVAVYAAVRCWDRWIVPIKHTTTTTTQEVIS